MLGQIVSSYKETLMQRKKCFYNGNEDVVDTMGFGAEMTDDH